MQNNQLPTKSHAELEDESNKSQIACSSNSTW